MILKHTKSLDHVLLAVANFHKAKNCSNEEEAKQFLSSGINSLAKSVECEDCVECLAQLEEEQARAHAFSYFANVLEASTEEEDDNFNEFEEGSIEEDIAKELEDNLDLGLESEDIEANSNNIDSAHVDIEPKEEVSIEAEKEEVNTGEQNQDEQNLDPTLLKLDDAKVPTSNDNLNSTVEPTPSVQSQLTVENNNNVQEEGTNEADASLVELCARLRKHTDLAN